MSSNALRFLVQRLEARAALTQADRDALLSLPHTTRMVAASAYVVREGDFPTYCALLVSGCAIRKKLTGKGERQILSFHGPGEPVGLQHLYLDQADHSIVALSAAEVVNISREALQALASTHASIGRAMLAYVLAEASIVREWILNVGRRNAETRIAHLLCEFASRLDAQRLPGTNGYRIKVTQDQLGDAVGVTPVCVNRVLKSLEAKGLIARTRREISLPKLEQLRAFAGFDARYLHLARRF